MNDRENPPPSSAETEVVPGLAAGPAAADNQPGDRIGKYRLLKVLGQGGMGKVWLAEQQEPIRRQVALKIVKQGMDTQQVVTRFESERQVLALLDHPNIAKVLDAGATDRGRPFFVMEYVQGEPITDFCDRHQLTTRERLELFSEVCEGIQHAHRNAIIHRDIKPSNVLVAVKDKQALPKIIDFGVAKATDLQYFEETRFTQLGQLVGTPEYMSPEQAEMGAQGIDTRTDIYSLGVLLYELLVGVLPFDIQELRRAGFDEIRRRIREDEPARPSTRLSTLDADLPTLAKARKTNPAKLSSQLRGDLDWIVMKALDKDPTRRYETPVDLAADLRRHLENEPVTASPPSVLYRARKFVRRHTVGVAFTAVIVALVSTLAVTMTIQAGRIARERDRANRQAALAAAESETSRQVAEFLVGLFEVSEPDRARGNSITAREVLDRGAERIQTELKDQPAVQATMLRTIGRVYTELGLYDEALPLLKKALELGKTGSRTEDLELAATRLELAMLSVWLGDLDEAESHARSVVALREKHLGPGHRDVATGLNALGNVLQNQGRLEEARPVHERALAIREALADEPDMEVGVSLHNLAIVYYFLDDLDKAEELYKRSAALERKVLGEDNPGYATTLHTLAIVYQDQGRLDEALELELKATDIREKVLGTDHLHFAFSLCTLGNIQRLAGRATEGEPHLRRALAIAEDAVGPDHGETLWMRHSLAQTLIDISEYTEAEGLLQRSLLSLENEDDPEQLTPGLGSLALVQHRQGRLAEAEATYSRVLGIMRGSEERPDPDRLEALRDHARVLRKLGRGGEASGLEAEADSLEIALRP